jgi:hypothetical protein
MGTSAMIIVSIKQGCLGDNLAIIAINTEAPNGADQLALDAPSIYNGCNYFSQVVLCVKRVS